MHHVKRIIKKRRRIVIWDLVVEVPTRAGGIDEQEQ
jgi:hypothetical protein